MSKEFKEIIINTDWSTNVDFRSKCVKCGNKSRDSVTVLKIDKSTCEYIEHKTYCRDCYDK